MKNLAVRGTIIILIIIFFTYIKSQAQLGLGIKGGFNLSFINNMNPIPKDGQSISWGFLDGNLYGVIVNYNISPRFALKTDLLYSTQGNRFTLKEKDLRSTTTHRFNYLQLPILVKYNLTHGRFKWFINAGPYIAYLLSVKYIFLNPDRVETSFYIDSDKEGWNKINKIDFGICGGTGLIFRLGPGDIILEARQNVGFRNVLEVNQYQYDEENSWSNVNVNFSAGYIYTFKKKKKKEKEEEEEDYTHTSEF